MNCAKHHISRTQLHVRYLLVKDVVCPQSKRKKKILHLSVAIFSFSCVKLHPTDGTFIKLMTQLCSKPRDEETDANYWTQALPADSLMYQKSQTAVKFS